MKTLRLLLTILVLPYLVIAQYATDPWVFHHQSSDGWFGSIAEFKNGNILVGGGDPNSDFRIYDGNTWSLYTKASFGVSFNIFGRSLAIDTNDMVWISSGFDGISKWDGITMTNYNTSNSGIARDRVGAIGIDNNNELWLERLQSFNGATWDTVVNNNNCQSDGSINFFVSDNNEIWFTNTTAFIFGVPGGILQPIVNRIANNTATCFHVSYGDSLPILTSGTHLVNQLSDGTVFIVGRTANGIEMKKFDGANWINWEMYNGSEVGKGFWGIWVDENDNILIGGEKNNDTAQIVKYCNGSWTFYDLPVSMGFPYIIFDLMVDKTGRLWIAGANTGLCSLNYSSNSCTTTNTDDLNRINSFGNVYYANGYLHTQHYQYENSQLDYRIINMIGQTILQGKLTDSRQYIGMLETGIYNIHLSSKNGNSQVTKIYAE